MLRIAICDDDPDFVGTLQQYAEGFFAREGVPHSISVYTSPEAFWEVFECNPFQIVVLDILMPGLNGIALSKRVYEHNPRCVIAFVSSSPDFALDGYGVNAIKYLLKPLDRDKAHGLFASCLERIGRLPTRHVLLKMGGVVRRVDAEHIVYLESRNKYVHANCDGEEILHHGKLSDLLMELPPSFVQVHKSYAVNLVRVRSMTNDAMMTDSGESVPISRLFRADARKRYLDHVDGEV